MTNTEILKKMGEDMDMRNFSHYTYDFYIRKTKDYNIMLFSNISWNYPETLQNPLAKTKKKYYNIKSRLKLTPKIPKSNLRKKKTKFSGS